MEVEKIAGCLLKHLDSKPLSKEILEQALKDCSPEQNLNDGVYLTVTREGETSSVPLTDHKL
jgi:hypothetical protein